MIGFTFGAPRRVPGARRVLQFSLEHLARRRVASGRRQVIVAWHLAIVSWPNTWEIKKLLRNRKNFDILDQKYHRGYIESL